MNTDTLLNLISTSQDSEKALDIAISVLIEYLSNRDNK